MSRGPRRHARRASRAVDRREPGTPAFTELGSILAGAELMVAHLDGRPLIQDFTAEGVGAAIGGLGGLVYALAAHIAGDDSPAAVRTLLVETQTRARLNDVFGATPDG